MFSRQALRKGISFLFECAGPLQKGSMASAAMRNREQGGHCSLQELRVGLAHLLEGDVLCTRVTSLLLALLL